MKFFNKSGAFLLEALVSTVILGVGLIGVIRSFSMAVEAYKLSQQYQSAAVLLENKLTELVSERYWDDSLAGEGECGEPFSGYRYEVSVKEVDHSDLLKEVAVVIFWPGSKQERFLRASTYLLKNPKESV